MKKSVAIFVLFTVVLAGCSAVESPVATYNGLELSDVGREPRPIDSKHLLVTIPEWAGTVKSARQINEGDLARQTILIPRDGGDGYEIEAQIETHEDVNRRSFRLHAPTAEEIGEELKRKFPGVEMRIVERRAGDTIDMAIGRSADGTRCLYAWQWNDDVHVALDESGIAAVKSLISQRTLAASLRIRLCNRFTTLDDLASLARQIRFDPTVNFDQIMSGSALSQSAAPSPIKEAVLENSLACAAQTQPSSLDRHTSPPLNSKRKRALLVKTNVKPDAQLSSPGMRGPRYLAPVPMGPDGAVPPGPSTSTTAAGALDLPPAALHGPAAQSGVAPIVTDGH